MALETEATPVTATSTTEAPPTPNSPASSSAWDVLDKLVSVPDEAPKVDAPETPETPPPDTTPKADAAPKPDASPKPPGDKTARTIEPSAKVYAENRVIKRQVEEANAKIVELERWIKEGDEKGKDTTALSERLAAIEKERDEAKVEAARARGEVSPELKAKYEAPFHEAAYAAKELISQFVVTDPASGTQRMADWAKDFGGIYGLPRPAAKEHAKTLFGEEATTVMAEYDKLHAMERNYTRAKAAEAEQWQQRETAKNAETIKQREGWAAAQRAAEKGYQEKYPQFFGEDPADPERTMALRKGFEDLDSVPKTFQEAVSHRARIRLKAAAFDSIAAQLHKSRARVTELEAKLSGKNGSAPGGGKAKPQGEAKEEDPFDMRAFKKTLDGLH